MNDDTPTITQQYSFAVSDDGVTDGIEPSEESVETSLEAFGASVDHRERDTRIDQPEASRFGVDDRPEVTSGDGGEQGALFANTDDDQQTLTGERAASQCLFESDDTNDTDEAHDDEPADTNLQAVATDGGNVENPDDETDANSTSTERTESANDSNHETDTDTATASESRQDDTFDPNAETVTDAWQGAYISTNWGYGQTNVELAQIVEVSDSGKTVLARLVGAEHVGHGRTSKQLRPTANHYGDEFRLHVRSGGDGDPMFRGSYPLGSDGDMDDGPIRRGWFSLFDNAPENSIRATRTNFGH